MVFGYAKSFHRQEKASAVVCVPLLSLLPVFHVSPIAQCPSLCERNYRNGNATSVLEPVKASEGFFCFVKVLTLATRQSEKSLPQKR